MMPGLFLLTYDLPGKGFPLGRDIKKGARIIFGGKYSSDPSRTTLFFYEF